MIVLRANRELEDIFKKLIQAMGVRVTWHGRFIISDNRLILAGELRSLTFYFDTRAVKEELLELTVDETAILDIERHPKLQNLINMNLYAFGKWGTLKGLRVDKDYVQLNRLFAGILQEYYIEPEFRSEDYRFYRNKIRITFEEVIEAALLAEHAPGEEPKEQAEEESAQGLWHKLVWKNAQRVFKKSVTTLAQRRSERIGNNFYLTGYHCPVCQEKLHMVVYPVGQELRIETEERGVFLARAYTCDKCNCFFTPRPGRLLMEGSIYEMSFGSDRKAYEDYLELLGERGTRAANYKFNEYEAIRSQKQRQEQENAQDTQTDELHSEDEASDQLEALCARLENLPDEAFLRFTGRIEDGFYPDAAVARQEKKITVQAEKRQAAQTGGVTAQNQRTGRTAAYTKMSKQVDGASRQQPRQEKAMRQAGGTAHKTAPDEAMPYTVPDSTALEHTGGSYEAQPVSTALQNDKNNTQKAVTGGKPGSAPRTQADGQMEKYRARLNVLDRFSDRQRAELKKQILNDKALDEQTRQQLLRPIEEAKVRQRIEALRKKTENIQNRNYRQLRALIEEVTAEAENLSPEFTAPFLELLHTAAKKRGGEEVREMMEKLPQQLDRAGYQRLTKQLAAYEDVDLSAYADTLGEKRQACEQQEIVNTVKRARKKTREDCVELMKRLEEQSFAQETVDPYMEKIRDRVRELDERRIDEICGNVMQMDYDTAVTAYEQIEQGDFLPELKQNARERLTKRLQKIKSEECELLADKLRDEMKDKIADNPRHHFYPARKVLLKTAAPEETRVIDCALLAYAAGRGLFEYPVLTVDTSKNQSGKEGMTLTPEHIYYSTLLNAYEIPVGNVASIKASTGLLNRKITVEEKNGAKHKLPYAAAAGELKDWADILERFVRYLQEKPASRKLTYLAKEKHETICCFRCGYVYHGSDICPKCGYKKNH